MLPEVQFLKSHERLLIVILILLAAWFIGSKYLGYADARDQRNAIISQQALQAQKDQNTQIAVEVQQMVKDNQAFANNMLIANQRILTAQEQRDVATKKQQTADEALTGALVATRWQNLLGLPAAAVKPVTGGYAVSDSAGRTTLEQLELVPSLQADLKDETTIVANKDQEIGKANELVSGLQREVGGLHVQITDADKACKDEIKTAKDHERRKHKWYALASVMIFEAARRALTGGF